jgi:hypothetical protein
MASVDELTKAVTEMVSEIKDMKSEMGRMSETIKSQQDLIDTQKQLLATQGSLMEEMKSKSSQSRVETVIPSGVIPKPEKWPGTAETFEFFKTEFENWIGSVNPKLPELCRKSRQLSDEDLDLDLMSEEEKALGTILRAHMNKGDGPIHLRGIRHQNGYRLWRKVCKYYEGKDFLKYVTWKNTLVSPDFPTKEKQWAVAYYEWIDEMAEYETESGKTIAEEDKYGALFKVLPEQTRRQMALQADKLDTWPKLSNFIETFLQGRPVEPT